MASNYTEHYGLSQWEGADPFLRSEFNEDFRKIDGGIHGLAEEVRQLSDRLVPISYNVYNLALQSYYEGKETGWKKALVFDGFLDGTLIEKKSPQLILRDQAIRLYLAVQGDVSWAVTGYSDDAYGVSLGTRSTTATGAGLLQAFSGWHQGGAMESDCALTLKVIINGHEAGRQRFFLPPAPAESQTPFTVTLAQAVPVIPGDSFTVQIETEEISGPKFYLDKSKGMLAGSIQITAASAEAGRLEVVPVTGLERWDRSLLYFRYSGGNVVPHISGGTPVYRERREALNSQGSVCTEECWEGPAGSDTLRLTFDLSRGGEPQCVLFDYGLLLY